MWPGIRPPNHPTRRDPRDTPDPSSNWGVVWWPLACVTAKSRFPRIHDRLQKMSRRRQRALPRTYRRYPPTPAASAPPRAAFLPRSGADSRPTPFQLADDLRARSSSGRKCALRADASTRLALFALRWTPCRDRARAAILRRTASAATRRSAASVPGRGRTSGFGGSGQRRGAVERAGPRTTRGSRCGSLETAVASHIACRGTSHALPACLLATFR